LAAASADSLQVWDVIHGSQLWIIRKPRFSLVAVSPDGLWIVGQCETPELHLLDAASGAHVKELRLAEQIHRLHFSDDGRRLITDRGALGIGSLLDDASWPEANTVIHFFVDRELITYAGRRILWLPPDRRRPMLFGFYGNTFASGGYSGTIAVVELDPSKIVHTETGLKLTPGCYTWIWPRHEGRKAGKRSRILRRIGLGDDRSSTS
jgi:WD40 repeat protein